MKIPLKLSLLLAGPARRGRNYFIIDAVRGLAALAVLLYHYLRFFDHQPQIMAQFGPFQAAPWAFELGGVAVLLFFSVSGFVFLHVYGTQSAAPSGWTFFVNRFSRLYPLHLLTLLTVAALQIVSANMLGRFLFYQENGLSEFVQHLFFASNWFGATQSFNGPIWSVSVEVLVYFIFYLYLRLAPVNLISLAAMMVLGMVGFVLTDGDNLIAMCMIYFFYGCLAYTIFSLLPLTRLVAFLTGLALAAAGAVILAGSSAGISAPMTLWLPVLYMLLLMVLAQVEGLAGSLKFEWARPLGDITYSSYLWHTPFQLLLMLAAGAGLISAELFMRGWFLGVFVGVTLVIALLSFHYIERPAQRALRDRMLGTGRPSGPQVAP